MERPPQPIIDYFYKLSDYNPQKRLTAASELLQNEETLKFKDYILDRLIKGLASGKSGARLGFSTTLSVFLKQNPDLLTAEEFLALVNEKLPMKVAKKERSQNAIGQHLAFAAVYSAAAFVDSLYKIIKSHIALLDYADFLRLSFAEAITLLLTNLREVCKGRNILPSEDLLKLLELIETIERDENNTGLYGQFSKELVSLLDDESYLSVAKKSLKQESWCYNRLIVSFGRRSSTTKQVVIELLLALYKKEQRTFAFTCSLIERFFRTIYRKGQLKDVALKEEDAQLLLKLFPEEKTAPKQKLVKAVNKTFETIAAIFRFVAKVAYNDNEAEQYNDYAKTACALSKTPHSQSIIDFCLSLLRQKQRLCRTLVSFITSKEHSLFDTDNLNAAIKSLTEPEDDDIDDDGEFKPITDEERRVVYDKWAAEEVNGDESDDNQAENSPDEINVDDDTMDENEENVEVNPDLRANVQNALGGLALTEEDQSDVEMNDEEIEELDRSLGAAFKHIIQKRQNLELTNGNNKAIYWLESVLKMKDANQESNE